MDTFSKKFMSALSLAQSGDINESYDIFQSLVNLNSHNKTNYIVLVNLGVLELQQGKLIKAEETLLKAIELDPYSYIAYYNLFIGSYCQGKIKNERERSSNFFEYLSMGLSCILADLGRVKGNLIEINKAIEIWKGNAMAYVYRAEIFEKCEEKEPAEKNLNEAFAIDSQNASIILKRACFYFNSCKIEESHNLFMLYQLSKNNPKEQRRELILPKIEKGEVPLNVLVEERIRLFTEAISELSSYQSKKPQKTQSEEPIEKLELKLEQKVSLKLEEEGQDNEAVEELGQNEQSNPLVDESSKNISEEIEKLENEIRKERGKFPLDVSEDKSVLNEENFLTEEIEKASQEIENIKSLPSLVSPPPSEGSITSKYSEKIVSLSDIKSYKKINIEIVSAQLIDSNSKIESRILVKYGKQKKETMYSKNGFWRAKFELEINHSLYKTENEQKGFNQDEKLKSEGKVEIEMEVKTKSVWRNNKNNVIGKGDIDILTLGENKCFLYKDKEQVGIVYFKIKLL